MQNYRNFAQTGGALSQRSPHAPQQARRGPAGPMVAPPPHPQQPPQMSHEAMQRQMQEEMRKRERARNRSLKPTDRDIPDEVSESIVGDGVKRYKELRNVERKLDSTMVRKRLDVTDNMQRRYARREGIMRVWISNTADRQPWQVLEEGGGINEDGTFEFGDSSSDATYRVKIEGRLLDDEQREEEDLEGLDEEEKERMKKSRPRFSNFFKAITIDFDRSPQQQPGGYEQIEWRKPQPTPQNPAVDTSSSEVSFDCLEFERKADEKMNVTVNLVRDEKSERFKLSPQLADILDTDEEDRAGAVQGIWEYCRAMGLQEDGDRRSVVCDEPLRRLFGRDQIYFPYIPELLTQHMTPLPPIQLHYTIRVDKPYISPPADSETKPCAPTVYDIRVPLPNPLLRQLTTFHTSKTHINDLRQIVQTDDDLALLVQKIHHTNAKLKFYTNLSRDPASFIKRWISSQQRDLEMILAEAMRGGGEGADGTGSGGAGEEWRKGGEDGVWGSQLARESVGLWLSKGNKAH